MSKMNRLATSKNYFQGEYLRVLTVCSAGLLRAPTIAWVIGQEPYNCNARPAGTTEEYALIPVDEVLVHWADLIICAEQEHADAINDKINWNIMQRKPIIVLDIPDIFTYRNEALVNIIEQKIGEKCPDLKARQHMPHGYGHE